MGDLEASKGGTVVMPTEDWPPTLRQLGIWRNLWLNATIGAFCYESLLEIHPITLELTPRLATHWQISEDKMTYRLRTNPRARWSDGHEVTADDVVATIRLMTDPSLADPGAMAFRGMDGPRAISKYIVEATTEVPNWFSFLALVSAPILPAHEIGHIDGPTYMEAYQFRHTAVSGPYEIRPEDISKGDSITLSRRRDYWGQDQCFARGRWNIGRIKFVVVRDLSLAFEKLKKGDIDYFGVPKAQWWAEEVDKIDGVRRGLIQKRKVFTDTPTETAGIAINTRRPPLDDRRVRLALCLLLNRKLMVEKLFFNQYTPIYSFYQGTIYQNPDNQSIPYDPQEAAGLLAEAGWIEHDTDGILVRDSERLELELQYSSRISDRHLTIFQEDCLRAGIKLNLQLLNRSTWFKNLADRRFDLTDLNLGGTLFPTPHLIFHSSQADERGTDNITGFKDPRVDSLCSSYLKAFGKDERIKILREIDGIVFNQHHYILTWCPPCDRILYWNRFGHPDWHAPRAGGTVLEGWWIDMEKDDKVKAGKADPSVTMPIGEVEVRFWDAYDKHLRAAEPQNP